MSEKEVFSTNAHLFQIDAETKKAWNPMSNSASQIYFYHDSSKNTYRIISLDFSNKTLLNSYLTSNMKFTSTSPKFGQWVDSKASTMYGIGFHNEPDLAIFADKFNEITNNLRPQSGPPKPFLNGENELTEKFKKLKQEPPIIEHIKNGNNGDNYSSICNSSNCIKKLEEHKRENEALKIQLKELSSQNLKYKMALEESTRNVNEWQKQLAQFSSETKKLNEQILDLEDQKNRLQKNCQGLENTKKAFELKQNTLEEEKMLLRRQVGELKMQTEVNNGLAKSQITSLQKQMSDKINDLYTMNDQLADVITNFTESQA